MTVIYPVLYMGVGEGHACTPCRCTLSYELKILFMAYNINITQLQYYLYCCAGKANAIFVVDGLTLVGWVWSG